MNNDAGAAYRMDTRGTGAFTGQSAKQRRDESTSTERMQLRTYRHDGQGCFTFGQRGVHGNGASHRARAGGDDAAQVRHRHADAEGGERHRECPLMAHLPREIKTEKQACELVVTSRQPKAARTPKQAVERNRSTRFCECLSHANSLMFVSFLHIPKSRDFKRIASCVVKCWSPELRSAAGDARVGVRRHPRSCVFPETRHVTLGLGRVFPTSGLVLPRPKRTLSDQVTNRSVERVDGFFFFGG